MNKLRRVAIVVAAGAAFCVPAAARAQSAARAVPAEDTAAAVADPAWTPPRTS